MVYCLYVRSVYTLGQTVGLGTWGIAGLLGGVGQVSRRNVR